MAKDLKRILKETEEALSTRPQECYTQLEQFTRRNNKVLDVFLEEDDKSNTNYSKYRFKKPPGALKTREQLLKMKQMSQQEWHDFRHHVSHAENLEGNVSTETIDAFGGSLSSVCMKMTDMTSNWYESIVAYAKQIAAERNTTPVKVVSREDLRDEIYQRIFPKREYFEFYKGVELELVMTMWGSILTIANKISEKLQKSSIPLVLLPLAKRKAKKVQQIVPQRQVIESFYLDQKNYIRQRADRIYNNQNTSGIIRN